MILGLDSATEILHLALVEGGQTWTRRVQVGQGKSHSGALLPALDALLHEARALPSDLTGVAACAGPGGFTSLRIGVATAEGLALTGLPVWGFSAFALRERALRAAGHRGPAGIVLDGQRGEAFFQRWDEGQPSGPAGRHLLETLPALLEGAPWWSPASFRPRAEAVLGPMPLELPDEGEATLCGLVTLCQELPATPPEDPIHPFYLRETDAEATFPQFSTHLEDAHRRGRAR